MKQKVGELVACRDSLAIRLRLAGLDPTNAQWRRDEACILDHTASAGAATSISREGVASIAQPPSLLRAPEK
jgi:hypothetical protein